MKIPYSPFAKLSEKYLIAFLAIALCIGGFFISLMPKSVWPAIPGLVALCGILVFSSCFQTAFLLYSQSKLESRSSIALLASGYMAISLLAFARVIFLPGILFSTEALHQDSQISAWIWTIWHLLFPIVIIIYTLINSEMLGCPYSTSQKIFKYVPLIIVSLICLLFLLDDLLPPLVWQGNYATSTYIDHLILVLTVAAIFLLMKNQRSLKRQDLWLMLAVIVHGIDILYGAIGEARYSLGWYLGLISSVISSSVILSVFIYEIFRYAHLQNQEKHQLKNMAETDPLTEVANKRKFEEMFHKLWDLSHQQQSPICLILVDIDHFKPYNDTYGHLQGDECLKKVAHALKRVCRRQTDLVARVGGEEFALILYGVDLKMGVCFADEAKQAVEALRLPHTSSVYPYITVSIGCGAIIGSPSADKNIFYNQVDQSLYKAKKAGKNRVESLSH